MKLEPMQSPIDLNATTVKLKGHARLELDYRPTTIKLENNGWAVFNHCSEGSYAWFDGTKYQLSQFHFHAQSEHTLNGKRFPFEVHFVHQNETGSLLVIGVLFEIGQPNPLLSKFWNILPKKGEWQLSPKQVNIDTFLDLSAGYFTYLGSLTTPPYTEGVRWVILNRTMELSRKQVQEYRKLFGMDTFREIQDAPEESVFLHLPNMNKINIGLATSIYSSDQNRTNQP